MKPINQILAQNGELTHDVPVTKSIFTHAGIFMSVVFVLFLGSELMNITKFPEEQHFSERAMSHNGAIAHNHHSGFKRF